MMTRQTDSPVPFLKEVAEDLYRLYGDGMQDLCLVFPNRRAGLFFNKYLGEFLDKPVWSPSILTIQDLMIRLSELEYAEDLELISRLYRVYSGVRDLTESFDEFLFWGEVMLKDFDEVDKYLVDAKDLFRNLADLKEMDRSFAYLSQEQLELIRRFWSTLEPGQSSPQKKQFLEIWNVLYPVYEEFRKGLLEDGIGYEGLVYRNVAENMRRGRLPDLPYAKFIFTGFNALNPCEQQVFRSLEGAGKAFFYWDYDEYYLDREMHEAGRFIRENLAGFGDSGRKFQHNNLTRFRKEINIYSIPSDTGQAQLVHYILEELREKSEPGEETAIVLADEELLLPVLNALPEDLKEINVTMGYPVSATPVFSLIEHLINLQQNLRRNNRGSRGGFYCRDVLPLLQHQYILLRQGKEAREIVRMIQEQNLIYVSLEILKGNALFEKIFRKLERPEDIATYLISVLEEITGKGEEDHPVPAIELEFIYRIYTRIKRLKDVLGRLEGNFTLPTFLRLFHKFLERTRIPFSGEPLAGIQVMGVLETRVLDFDRVILLSMNEGIFPRMGSLHSFIPHNLRCGFRLPTLEHQDAIYAYYFYRLLQRAGKAALIYNNKSEGLESGEKSRYIYQLKYDPAFRIQEGYGGFDLVSVARVPIRVRKTPQVMKVLKEACPSQGGTSYFSPSALNSYLDCPLQFYFNYVAGVREPVALQEEVDPALFGTLLHETVRELYSSLDNPVGEGDLKKILEEPEKIKRAIDGAFGRIWYMDKGMEPEGRNIVIREIIHTYVRKILEKDMEYSPLRIHSLEEKYEARISLLGSGITVRIGGKIDRIDRTEKGFRVLDYKTGVGSMWIPSIEDLFQEGKANRNRAAFQTFLYAKLFSDSGQQKGLPVTPGLYLIRDIYSPGFRFYFGIGTARKNIPVFDYQGHDPEFTLNLQSLLARLFDPDQPFLQTEEEENCRKCPYKGICHR